MAAELAQSKKIKGWVFTLDYPSYVPLMTYAENRELRTKMSLAYGRRGFQDNDHNNTSIILRLIELRKNRAKLLGYESHAAFVLEERMAASEENVINFLEDLYEKAYPAAQAEWKEMEDFAAQNLGLNTLEKWDTAYVSEKFKQSHLELDEQQLKPYFPLEMAKAGVFDIANKLYGLRFEKNNALEGYHPDVEVFEVFNPQGDFYALLYTDFFHGQGKRNGAWMTSYRGQKKDKDLIFRWFVIFQNHRHSTLSTDFSGSYYPIPRVWPCSPWYVGQYHLSRIERYQCVLGFCGTTEPGHGKLVL